MTDRTYRWLRIGALATVGLLAAGCGTGGGTAAPTTGSSGGPTDTAPGGSATPAATEKPSITIGFSSLGYNTVVPLAAVEELQAMGYTVEPAILDTAELSVEGVADGRLQFGASGNSTALLAMEAGGQLKFFLDELANEWSLYARREIQNCDQLDGQPVGIFSEGGVSTAMVRNYFATECPGVTPNYLVLGDSATRAAALVSGQIQATPVELSDALNLDATAGDTVYRLSSFAESLPNLKTTSFYGNTAWMEEHPEATKDFIRAVIGHARRAVDDPAYFNELVDRHYPDAPDETREAATEAYLTGGFLPINGGLTGEDLEYTIDFFTDAGVLQGGLTADQAADLSYLEEVLAEIGTR